MMSTIQVATLFLVLATVAEADVQDGGVQNRLHAFQSDEENDVTGQAHIVADKVDALVGSSLRQAGGFLARRKDKAWLEDKIKAEKHWKESREESFMLADTDKNNALMSGEEVLTALIQHTKSKENANYNAEQLTGLSGWLEPCKAEPDCAAALFQRVDMNRDGKVSRKEYHDYLFDGLDNNKAAVQKRANKKVLRSLRGADSDNDGIVSQEEFYRWMNEMDFALESAAQPVSYKALDEDADGKVTTKEFSRQLLKLVGDAQTNGATKDELAEAGSAAMNFAAGFIEESTRARKGFWSAYALKKTAERMDQAPTMKMANGMKLPPMNGGKVN